MAIVQSGHHAGIGLHSGYYTDLFCWFLFVCIFPQYYRILLEASLTIYSAPALFLLLAV